MSEGKSGVAQRGGANQIRFVGAPLVGALLEGTHEGCPYESRKKQKGGRYQFVPRKKR